MIHISVNELKYLKEIINELNQEAQYDEANDAVILIDGLIEEGRKLTDARLQQILDEHKELLARSKANEQKETQD
jgi:hypothetical protein